MGFSGEGAEGGGAEGENGVIIAEPSNGVGGERGDELALELASLPLPCMMALCVCTQMGALAGEAGAGSSGLVPWMRAQQRSHTRSVETGDVGEAKAAMGTPRGGLRKGRCVTSSRGVVRREHALQKMPPHLRQCYYCDWIMEHTEGNGNAMQQ